MRAVTSATWCVCVSSTVWCLGRLLRCGSRFHSDAWLTKRGHADQGQYWQHCVACLVHFATALAERPRCISWMQKYKMDMAAPQKERMKERRQQKAAADPLPTCKLKAGDCGKSRCCGMCDCHARKRESVGRERERGNKGLEGDRGRRLATLGDREAEAVC